MKPITMTDSDIVWLRKALRKLSIKWPGRTECLNSARRRVKIGTYKNGKPQYKYHWKCASCERWTADDKAMQVDHIVEIGSFEGDWNSYLVRHFPPDRTKVQALCIPCHLKKTNAYNAAPSKWKRK